MWSLKMAYPQWQKLSNFILCKSYQNGAFLNSPQYLQFSRKLPFIHSVIKMLTNGLIKSRLQLQNSVSLVADSLCSKSSSHATVFPKRFTRFVWVLPLSGLFFNSETDENDKEDELLHIVKLAILAKQREEYEKSEQLLHVALKLAQDRADELAITHIYDLMANFAYEDGNYKKAEILFIDVLKRFLIGGMSEEDNAIVEVSLKLSSIHVQLGELDKAVQGYRFCISTQESKLKDQGEDNVDEDTLVLWAMSHDHFARLLLNARHYDRAKEHFLRAYDVCVKIKGEGDPQTAVLLNDLGSASCMLQNYDEAIKYFERAIDLGRAYENEELSSFYVNLGMVYIYKNMYRDAENSCREGVRLAKENDNKEAIDESQTCLDTIKELQS